MLDVPHLHSAINLYNRHPLVIAPLEVALLRNLPMLYQASQYTDINTAQVACAHLQATGWLALHECFQVIVVARSNSLFVVQMRYLRSHLKVISHENVVPLVLNHKRILLSNRLQAKFHKLQEIRWFSDEDLGPQINIHSSHFVSLL
ncbi:hypothetical protein D3C75_1071600 [compost metagenome]